MAEPPTSPSPSSKEDPFGLRGITIGNKYRVGKLVGRGGFGVVYRGVHTGFGEPIAIKCLKIDESIGKEKQEVLLTRLQDEGRVLHRLSKLSSGIVQALDVGALTTPDGRWVPYLVLEWLEGETLARALNRRRLDGEAPLELQEAMALLEPAAKALGVAHRQKVAHRDVKPENLYITEVSGTRTLKVLDFGIAKVLTQHASFTAAAAATQKNATAFTPSYGAPEQFNKKRGATGPWTDVFALALILVELVTGERALDGDDATQLYIAAADPASRPTLRYHGVDTSDDVERVLSQALAIDPSDRFQDAGAFWEALREAADFRSTSDRVSADVSETGEFVSRHEIDLTAAELSNPPSDAVPAQPSTKPNGSSPPKRGPLASNPVSSGRIPSARTKPSHPGDDPDAAIEPSTPTVTPQASSRWLPVVVLLAVAGAALLYIQLRKISRQPTPPKPRPSAPHTVVRPTPPEPGRSAAATSVPSASASAATSSEAIDAGEPLDAGSDADVSDAAAPDDAGSEPAPIVPPSGMVLLRMVKPDGELDRMLFMDAAEVTTAAYNECVMADRCEEATRIVLTPGSAKALGVAGVGNTTSPEQLAAAWGSRCNYKRRSFDHPINCVNQASARDYCRFRNKRLPTSAEWSLAAGGEGALLRKFPWGETQPECSSACYGRNGSCVGTTREVTSCASGSRAGDRTPEGMMDLAGNLSEWVEDSAERPGGGRGPAWRLLRGGNFIDEARWLTSETSRTVPATTAHVTIGFRCAADVDSAASDAR